MRISSWQVALVASVCVLGTVPAKAQVSTGRTPVVEPVFVAPSGVVTSYAWAGVGFTNSFVGPYVGGLVPFNRNLNSEGLLLRVNAYGGRYSYNNPPAFPNTHVNVLGGDVMLGYRKAVGAGWLTAYVGGAFENHDNADPAASIRGAQGGGKGLIEYWTPITQNLWVYGNGSYSTVFETWTAFGRIGYKLTPQVTIGPEGSVFGNNAPYREARVGGFVSFSMPVVELSVAGGYRHPLTPGPDGYYANATLGFPFH